MSHDVAASELVYAIGGREILRYRYDLAEQIDWVDDGGVTVIVEARRLCIGSIDEGASCWTLRWISELRNVSGDGLELASPAVLGRRGARYCALFWRGPDRSPAGGF